MNRIRWIGCIALLVLSQVAWQTKKDVMPWRTVQGPVNDDTINQEAQAILTEARDRNVPVLLYVGNVDCPRCQAMKAGAFQNEAVQKVCRDKLICAMKESHTQDALNGPGEVLLQRVSFESGPTPLLFFLSPDGSELRTYRHGSGKVLSAGELGDLIQKVVKEVGNSISVSDYKKFIEAIQKAEESVKEGSYKVALGKLAPIAQSSVKKAGIVQRAKEKVEEILKIGDGLLSEAKQLEAEKKWIEAHQKYQFVDKEFGTSKAGKDARDAVARLLKDPEAGKAIKAGAK